MSFRPIKGYKVKALEDPAEYYAPQKARKGSREFVMSRSELVAFGACAHKWLYTEDERKTPAMDWGTLMDVCVLTPARFDSVFSVAPETYPSIGMECPVCKRVTDSKRCRDCKTDRVEVVTQEPWTLKADHCKKWKAQQEAAGMIVVNSDTASLAWKAAKMVQQNEHIAAFHAVSQKQVAVMVEWHDDETGLVIPFKALVDLMPDPSSDFGDTLADFKTTNDASERAWEKTVGNYNLHVQAALYLDSVNAATGLHYRSFEHHIQESAPPFEVTHRMLSNDPQGAENCADFISLGRVKYQKLFRRYCDALNDSQWKGYDTNIVHPNKYIIDQDAA